MEAMTATTLTAPDESPRFVAAVPALMTDKAPS